MSSMDKRKGARIGKPARKAYVAVVLMREQGEAEVGIYRIFSNMPKAQAEVDRLMCQGGGRTYWAERWPVE